MVQHASPPVESAARTLRVSRRAVLRAGGGVLAAAAFNAHRYHSGRAQEGALATPDPLGPVIPPEITAFRGEWPAPHGSLEAHRAAAGSPINAGNIARLSVAWRLSLTASGYAGSMTCIPIVAGDVVYVQDGECNVLAIDRQTGVERWRHEEHGITAGPNGVAIGYGRIFAGNGFAAEVFALDAESGAEIWRSKLSANPYEWTLTQPLVYDNVVYTGTSPGAYAGGSRGIFFALEAGSGNVLWQWDTTVDNLWGNARLNAGGGLWYPPSIDAAGNIFFGTGNPAPWPETVPPAESTRPGPNLYANSMVSLDPVTGGLRWYVQAKAHDQLDHDFQLTPILADVPVDGLRNTLAIGAGKTGTVIAANADNGEVVWKTTVGDHNAFGDGAPLPAPSATPVVVLPGPYGGVLTPMAFAHDTVFAPVVNLPLTYTDAGTEFDLASATSELVALSAADGSRRWSKFVETMLLGGATVANDVVFSAGLDGVIRAFETGTGTEIWRYQTGAGINAPPAIAGDLLIVPAGTALSSKSGAAPANAELIAFRLEDAGSRAAT